MENIKKDFEYFGGLTFIYGVIFVICLYENFMGITFPIYVGATIGFAILFLRKMGQTLKKSTFKYFLGMILLGLSTFMTANSFVHFFNWVGIILLFITGMIHQLYDDKEWGFVIHLKNLLKLLGTSIVNLIAPFKHSILFLKNYEEVGIKHSKTDKYISNHSSVPKNISEKNPLVEHSGTVENIGNESHITENPIALKDVGTESNITENSGIMKNVSNEKSTTESPGSLKISDHESLSGGNSTLTESSKGIIKSNSKERKKGKNTVLMVLLGLGLALFLSLLIVPLLMISDEIFAQFFINLFRHVNIRQTMGITITFLIGTIPFYSFFFSLFKRNLKAGGKEGTGKNVNSTIGISFTFVFAIIYLIYSVIQILFLFLRFEGGLPENVTYYQYAHQGFWQLLAVSLINFVMVLVCIQVFKENKVLKILLLIISICTCIMTVSAAYRMLLYVGAYHLTFLRVLVLWFLGVLTLIMGGVMVSIYKDKFRLFKYVMVVVACGYILFSFARVDFIIASYNLAYTENITRRDVRYLMNELSLDAAPAIGNFDLSNTTCELAHRYLAGDLESYYNRILKRDNSGRRWNLSVHIAQRIAEQQGISLNAYKVDN